MKKKMIFYILKCKKVLKKFNKIINNTLMFLILTLIKFYSFFISPLLGTKCRYLPTCSEYSQECLKLFGLGKGSLLTLKRILKCHPIKILGGSYGVDFVPKKKIKFKGLN